MTLKNGKLKTLDSPTPTTSRFAHNVRRVMIMQNNTVEEPLENVNSEQQEITIQETLNEEEVTSNSGQRRSSHRHKIQFKDRNIGEIKEEEY